MPGSIASGPGLLEAIAIAMMRMWQFEGERYRSNAAFRRLSCGTSGLPIGAVRQAGVWIVVSSRRTLVCRLIERAIRSCNCCGSFAIMSSGTDRRR